MSDETDFIGLVLAGEVMADEIDDFVAAWHNNPADCELHAFLGMTWEEYQLWVNDPAYLSIILLARSKGEPLSAAVRAVNDNYAEPMRIAARSSNPERVRQLQAWLTQNG